MWILVHHLPQSVSDLVRGPSGIDSLSGYGPPVVSFFKKAWKIVPIFPVWGQVSDQPPPSGSKVVIETDAGEHMADRVGQTDCHRVVFHRRSRDATAFPTVVVQVGTEFQIGSTEAKIFNHPETTVKDLAWINGGPIRDSPIVIEILDGITDAGRSQLVRGFELPTELAFQVAGFSGGPD